MFDFVGTTSSTPVPDGYNPADLVKMGEDGEPEVKMTEIEDDNPVVNELSKQQILVQYLSVSKLSRSDRTRNFLGLKLLLIVTDKQETVMN